MQILIIGSGIVGLVTAYKFLAAGLSVTLIDKETGPCQATSWQNGGQLSYSHAISLNKIANYANLSQAMLQQDYALKVKLRILWQEFLWFKSFKASKKLNYDHDFYAFAKISKIELEQIAQQINYKNIKNSASIHILHNKKHFAKMIKFLQQQDQASYQILDLKKLTEILPNFNLKTVKAAILFKEDQVADARDFGLELFSKCQQFDGFDYIFSAKATKFHQWQDSINAVEINHNQVIKFDKLILATGAKQHKEIFSLCSLKSPLIEVRGYSVNFAATKMQYSLIDYAHKMVYSNLNNQLRIAGLYDFYGSDNYQLKQRVENFISKIRAENLRKNQDSYKIWHGYRPVSKDGYPIIGRSAIYKNLYYNLAHANLGWTLAAASSKILLDEVLEQHIDKKYIFLQPRRFNI
ncbi:MAG: NAD(P)/FAD-dependent oxidoreductase [Rickettsiales bacterium]